MWTCPEKGDGELGGSRGQWALFPAPLRYGAAKLTYVLYITPLQNLPFKKVSEAGAPGSVERACDSRSQGCKLTPHSTLGVEIILKQNL